MAKIKAVEFHSDYCEQGRIKFKAGKAYAKNSETERCVTLNFGEVVSIDENLVMQPQPTEAEKVAAQKAATEQAAAEAEKAAAALRVQAEFIQALEQEIAALETDLVAAVDEDKPAIQTELDAKQKELLKLQSV